MENLTSKELFKKFSEKYAEQLPFSLQFNWWNEVVVSDWDVAILQHNEEPFGIMPYYMRKKGPWSLLSNAHFTPYCGPFLIYPEGQKTSTRIAFEHRSYTQLLEQLPTFSEYAQNYHLAFTNALAFQWQQFTETNRYTYILSLESEEKELWSNLRENNRKQIKKAEREIQLSETDDARLVQELLQQSVENKIETSYFERILAFIKKHDCGKAWQASENGNVHSVLLCINDSKSAYYLLGGNASNFKNSGAMSLLTWQALLYFKKLGIKQFNFEGSSIQSVEKYFRGFGGELQTFKRIEKKNSKSLELAKKLKGA